MFAIAPTDKKWFSVLKEHQLNSFVNFYTLTPWNVKRPKIGDRWYFLLKAPIRKISGFGELVEYNNYTIYEAWNKYGIRNGFNDIEDFTLTIQAYINKNSKKFKDKNIDIEEYKIGCVILKNCQFWDEEDYVEAKNHGISVAEQVVTRKIFNRYDPLIKYDSNGFNVVNEPREIYKSLTNQRKGQGKFKGIILKAYNNKCCISGETCPELLEAAHLQVYLNETSNHVQNGILLRVDLHRLFDNGLLYIDNNYKTHVSSLLESTDYRNFDGLSISLPEDSHDWPLTSLLELKYKNFRK